MYIIPELAEHKFLVNFLYIFIYTKVVYKNVKLTTVISYWRYLFC